MIKAIFFDVDGTLLSHTTKRISQDTVQAVRTLQDQGIRIFMATGRHSTELDQLPVHDIRFDGYITLNGQLCLDNRGNVIYGAPFNESITDKLLFAFCERRYPLALVESDRIYINYVNDTVCKAQQSISTPVPEISTYKGGQIYQATAFLTRQEETEAEKFIPSGCRFARWCDNGVDIISEQGGKVEGIKYFCDLYGISLNEIMAFGDAENDIDMLKTAEIGVAMGNAVECVRKCADYVTSDVDNGGIVKALRYFHLI
ncbi:Cof-type HAD-IIB family hydrolase [Mediterraneibacter glycyrrhizinilyticus]|jgi:hypothetical protein|uniref:Cof-type HAD-IIB family hydrolase n=1 Tax=Mediterraneibacter glycyrrhizinilyticus TaxID=342942 RepID=UPI0025AA4263|nr:Cof-type HAD-IIB family hydrolase [Mediterraneibacter glycyrrhizinilyticus]MDN0062002.1 Cof-type HAD-IIB family hydrolase [Mediterraneibacter glycyrrhizinilyticus]